VVKCNQCDQEFANSEDLKRHQEQSHPMGDVEGKEHELETPDLVENSAMDGAVTRNPDEAPEPAEQRDK
jgi:hypothetical protein